MGLRNLFRRRRQSDEEVFDTGLVVILDVKGNPVDPRRVFDHQGRMQPGFVPVQWEPPVLIMYTPEQLPVVTGTVLFGNEE